MESVHNLYVTYEKYIFKYLYSLTLDYYQAEELTQETFLRSLKYVGSDIESVGEISYEIERLHGKSSGTGPYLKSDGTVSLGSSGGGVQFPVPIKN
ncbi:MAG: sigma factor [Syntrophomonadaceae bacterium]|nr:sigma factor [Syntrophomonadaceae bacterium]MDD3271260.1 sigma factor [Syntrophomonadaceae bacterium]MDD3898459.1 sigma factor [Syntrophomonadaceae bacterium]